MQIGELRLISLCCHLAYSYDCFPYSCVSVCQLNLHLQPHQYACVYALRHTQMCKGIHIFTHWHCIKWEQGSKKKIFCTGTEHNDMYICSTLKSCFCYCWTTLSLYVQKIHILDSLLSCATYRIQTLCIFPKQTEQFSLPLFYSFGVR